MNQTTSETRNPEDPYPVRFHFCCPEGQSDKRWPDWENTLGRYMAYNDTGVNLRPLVGSALIIPLMLIGAGIAAAAGAAPVAAILALAALLWGVLWLCHAFIFNRCVRYNEGTAQGPMLQLSGNSRHAWRHRYMANVVAPNEKFRGDAVKVSNFIEELTGRSEEDCFYDNDTPDDEKKLRAILELWKRLPDANYEPVFRGYTHDVPVPSFYHKNPEEAVALVYGNICRRFATQNERVTFIRKDAKNMLSILMEDGEGAVLKLVMYLQAHWDGQMVSLHVRTNHNFFYTLSGMESTDDGRGQYGYADWTVAKKLLNRPFRFLSPATNLAIKLLSPVNLFRGFAKTIDSALSLYAELKRREISDKFRMTCQLSSGDFADLQRLGELRDGGNGFNRPAMHVKKAAEAYRDRITAQFVDAITQVVEVEAEGHIDLTPQRRNRQAPPTRVDDRKKIF